MDNGTTTCWLSTVAKSCPSKLAFPSNPSIRTNYPKDMAHSTLISPLTTFPPIKRPSSTDIGQIQTLTSLAVLLFVSLCSHKRWIGSCSTRNIHLSAIVYNAGETPADGRSYYVVNSTMAELARKLNGIIIVMEHRFYGKSMPGPVSFAVEQNVYRYHEVLNSAWLGHRHFLLNIWTPWIPSKPWKTWPPSSQI